MLRSRLGRRIARAVAWIKGHLLLLVVVGTLADVAVFGVQGYQIHLLNSQQHQITVNAEKNNCWSHILDKALKEMPKSHAQRDELNREAASCTRLP